MDFRCERPVAGRAGSTSHVSLGALREPGVAARSRGQGGSHGSAGLYIPGAWGSRTLPHVSRAPPPPREQQTRWERSISQTPPAPPKAAGRGRLCSHSGLGAALLCVSGEGCALLILPVRPELMEMEVATLLSRLVLHEGEPRGPLVASGHGAGAPAGLRGTGRPAVKGRE